jgi:hypothetical protein
MTQRNRSVIAAESAEMSDETPSNVEASPLPKYLMSREATTLIDVILG